MGCTSLDFFGCFRAQTVDQTLEKEMKLSCSPDDQVQVGPGLSYPAFHISIIPLESFIHLCSGPAPLPAVFPGRSHLCWPGSARFGSARSPITHMTPLPDRKPANIPGLSHTSPSLLRGHAEQDACFKPAPQSLSRVKPAEHPFHSDPVRRLFNISAVILIVPLNRV